MDYTPHFLTPEDDVRSGGNKVKDTFCWKSFSSLQIKFQNMEDDIYHFLFFISVDDLGK